MLNVHLRITEANTGQPTAARVRISSAQGTEFVPLGRFPEFPLGRNEAVGGQVVVAGTRWFYIDGWCEVPLPSGIPLRVQITKGPEYEPVDETFTLGAGQLSVRFALHRRLSRPAGQWLRVDTRCHFLTPHDALLEAMAEDLDVVNLLATVQPFPSLDGTAYPTVPNLAAFSGQRPALERGGCQVIVNTFNTHPVLGKVALLHSHRPVFPLTFGGDETDDWGLYDWCKQCHRKGGLVVWAEAFEPAAKLVGGEALVAAILGQIDAIEVTRQPRVVPLLPWVYRLWNVGLRIPLVGASGKDSNRIALGSVRTYARVEGFNWLEAVRAGHSFVTTGPLLALEVVGRQARASVQSLRSTGQLDLVANGEVLVSTTGDHLEAEVPEHGWVATRCQCPDGGFAHTSPITLGHPVPLPAAATALNRLIEQTREWAELNGRYTNPKRREQLLARCTEAQQKLQPALG
jgi:hypothetical protein